MNLKHYSLITLLCLSLGACATAPEAKNSTDTTTATVNEDPVETFLQGCKTELDAYCKSVTPGEGRILACIYAHSDKLSSRCEYAMYDSATQLERIMEALSYAINECDADLEKNCSNVQPGEGRLLACLEKNPKTVSSACQQALKDVGLKK
ncbi:MAG: cysteine rich repeat-containing protein [Methylococcaceae bacterium]